MLIMSLSINTHLEENRLSNLDMENWELIAKYLAGEATGKEEIEILAWLSESDENKKTLERLRLAMSSHKDEAVHDFSTSLEADWNAIQEKHSNRGKVLSLRSNVVYKIAASVLILFLVGLSVWKWGAVHHSELYSNISTENTIREVLLSDGTIVWLNKGATLEVNSKFGKEVREVTLKGEAYFEVAEDKLKPFIIICGKLQTQVLGTKFNIINDLSIDAKVTVTEGKVAVHNTENPSAKLYLKKGDVAIFNYSDKNLVKQINKDLNFLSWKTGKLEFTGESLEIVCSALSKQYRRQVRLDPLLKKHTITAVFDNVSLEQALSIISITLDVKIQEEDSLIRIIP